jgi:excisionase family DNA binding protein
MAQKLVTVEKAAEMLGLSPAEVTQLREQNRLRGFRDGATWKFKLEDVEQLVGERQKEAQPPKDDASSDDVLLSEVELGNSQAGASGTVIPPHGKEGAVDSDIQLADSSVNLGSGIDLARTPGDTGKGSKGGGGPDSGDLDLTLDEDISLEDSHVPLAEPQSAAAPAAHGGDSAVDLSAKEEKLADDDLVLGGSSSGSDITLGGDSGISLVDPADSGLSLEEPVELGAAPAEESLELGEDDMLSLDEAAVDTESPTELKTDDEFLLTPLEEGGDEEDSESGSQVIALDQEPVSGEAATMVAGAPGAMAAMLDEDVAGAGLGAGVAGMPAAGPAASFGAAAVASDAAAFAPGLALPEAPYSGLMVTFLVFCSVLLLLSGWMIVDLLRNMWSWNASYQSSSGIMNAIARMFGS